MACCILIMFEILSCCMDFLYHIDNSHQFLILLVFVLGKGAPNGM